MIEEKSRVFGHLYDLYSFLYIFLYILWVEPNLQFSIE